MQCTCCVFHSLHCFISNYALKQKEKEEEPIIVLIDDACNKLNLIMEVNNKRTHCLLFEIEVVVGIRKKEQNVQC